MNVHPLILQPIANHAAWGRSDWPFGLAPQGGEPVAEFLACEPARSLVANDDGRAIDEFISSWSEHLLGRASTSAGAFPIAAKWIGTSDRSPVQIDTVAGDGETSISLGKAWYVVDAQPNACVYRGLKPGANLDEVLPNVNRLSNSVEWLRPIPVRRGHCSYIAPGVPHAAGPGVLIAEIRPTGLINAPVSVEGQNEANVRAVRESIESAGSHDLSAFEKRSHVTSLFLTVTRVMTTPLFKVERVRILGEYEQEIPYAELVCWMVLEGRGSIRYGKSGSASFEAGSFVVLPAALSEAKICADTDCVWLEVTLPTVSDLAGMPRPSADYLRAQEGTTGHPIQLGIDRKREAD